VHADANGARLFARVEALETETEFVVRDVFETRIDRIRDCAASKSVLDICSALLTGVLPSS
jgi:hypothetical protein